MRLWHGKRATATTALAPLRDPRRPCPALEDAVTYLETQRDWLGTDAAWRAAGYPVGNGPNDQAIEVVIDCRIKRRGVRWPRDSASDIVAMRTDQLNPDWQTTMEPLTSAA